MQIKKLQAGVADADFGEQLGSEDVGPSGDGMLGAGAAESAVAGKPDAG